MARLELGGIVVRHRLGPLSETPAETFGPREVHLAHALAIGAGRQARPRNSGTARVSLTRLTSVTLSVVSSRAMIQRVSGAMS